MSSDSGAPPVSKAKLRAGRITSTLVVLLLLLDSAIKLLRVVPVRDTFVMLGYSENVIIPIGVLLIICTLIYAIPQTSILGAILLTGYLGGAVATHARHGDPLFTHALFPTYVGILLWGGSYGRDNRLRALILLREGGC